MFKSIRPGGSKDAAVVVGVFSDEKGLPGGLGKLSKSAQDQLREARSRPGFKGDAGEVIAVDSDSALVGLGKKADLKPETLRTIAAQLVKALDRMAVTAATLHIEHDIPAKSVSAETIGRCIGEGIGLGNWRVDFFDGEATKKERPSGTLTVSMPTTDAQNGLKRGLLLAESANYARRLAATPPNICNPTWIAAEARKLARMPNIACKIINFTEAKRLGMGGIVNVGQGSAHKPCLIILEYKPTRPVKGVKIALVGKTITYDTGGYSLKINNTMKGMKYDKSGGMAVLGAMHALATLKSRVHTVALLPAAENMVSSDAYRPDDIITMYNGVTVEVTNTDAEGRLVLADALAYACDKIKPTAVIDAATLTGGVVVALGPYCSGVWSSDEDLFERLQSAAESTGERIWRLPLWQDHRDFMRAKHADIWNSGPARDAHPIQGAAFLSYFVSDGVPWAHVDIAGVAAVESDKPPFVQGPTGYGVRLLTETVMSYE